MENMDAFEQDFMTPAELAMQDRLDAQQREFKADWYAFGSEITCGGGTYATLLSVGALITEICANDPQLYDVSQKMATGSGVFGIVLGATAAALRIRANRLRNSL